MFYVFIVPMIQFALLFPKCNLLGSYVADAVEVSEILPARTVCELVRVCVCVCIIRVMQHQFHFFLICLFFYMLHTKTN